MPDLRIYHLNDLEPEIRAVTFAKCSRSPLAFDEIAKELTQKKASEFHEKWVVGYGHSSVAEHAVLSLALENVSILATKIIEDNRLASYTEKSSRYQIFDHDKLYKPKKLMESLHRETFENAINKLMSTYLQIAPAMKNFIEKKYPTPEGVDLRAHQICLKGKICDNIRYLLPVATTTNLGMTINARNLEHAISKLLSHPLDEARDIGAELKKIGATVCPTLIKYADYNKYLAETPVILAVETNKIFGNVSAEAADDDVALVEYDKNAVDKILTAILYRFSNYPYKQAAERAKLLTMEQREQLLEQLHNKMETFDWPLREFEHVYYTFDITMDYGTFRDIQRHRICTQTNQLLAANLGFSTPPEIIEAGLQKEYLEAIIIAEDAWRKIAPDFPEEAQYVLPLACRKRTLITANLREMHHLIKLRSGKLGHFSYRQIAQKCFEKIKAVHPELAQYIRITNN
ncbi:FAD-dependent thymidylate synthase [Candidatus Falkowbacteria bacterium]|nr:FAD-dependent thymidylate synthase [Candidatus Falkowbacteria bacterium]